MVVVGGVRTLPLLRPGIEARSQEQLTYTGSDGRQHVYLGDYDSYAWLRQAHNLLDHGIICDRFVDGVCRNELTQAPLGGAMNYQHSLHVHSIAWMHRLMTWWRPNYPLPASAALVPVVMGVLGVVPAFALGWRVGGLAGAVVAALLIALNPLFLGRSIGSDNDVWNVVLPLFLAWGVLVALQTTRRTLTVAAALAALAVVGMHALTWDGWVFSYVFACVAAAGQLITALLVRRRKEVTALRGHGTAAALTCAALACAPLGAFLLAPSTAAQLVASTVEAIVVRPLSANSDTFPSAFSTVGELSAASAPTIAATLSGMPQLLVAWIGLLFLVLPRRDWRRRHYAVLMGGTVVLVCLLLRPTPGRAAAVALLALPLVVGLVLSLSDESPEPDHAAAFLFVPWFLAAFALSLDGLRFVVLLLPPIGVACAVTAGRAADWLQAKSGSGLAGVAAVALLVAVPVRDGYRAAAQYAPNMNDAWWDTLEHIRAVTPTTAIVTTWWPNGYWAEYVAERRTTVDGGTLPTHVPYWLARALFTDDEKVSIGLLRMLDCGSDLTPRAGKQSGAFGKLRLAGWTEEVAARLVGTIITLDRVAATQQLQAAGLSQRQTAAILEATHCAPPPGFLVLSSAMVGMPGWRALGAIATPGETAGPTPGYRTRSWVECQAASPDDAVVCPLNLQMVGKHVERFTYRRAAPGEGRLHWHSSNGDSGEQGMATTLIAGSEAMTEIRGEAGLDDQLAVLIDLPNHRILIAPPVLLRSTYTGLTFLDGRYARQFKKLDDRGGLGQERVITWSIVWPNP